MKQNILLSALISVVVVVAGLALFGGKTVVEKPFSLGAISTLGEVDDPYTKIGGAEAWYSGKPFAATSSVVCSFKNPYMSTSTVERAGFKVDVNRLGVQTIAISTSSNPYASTTLEFFRKIGPASGPFTASLQKNSATTSNNSTGGLGDFNLLPGRDADGTSNYLLNPGEYLNFRIATGSPGTFNGGYNTGSCYVEVSQ